MAVVAAVSTRVFTQKRSAHAPQRAAACARAPVLGTFAMMTSGNASGVALMRIRTHHKVHLLPRLMITTIGDRNRLPNLNHGILMYPVRCCVLIGSVFALVVLTGCKRPAARERLIGPLASNTLIAVVNGSNLYAGSLEQVVQHMMRKYEEATGSPMTDEQLSRQRRELIDQMILETIVRQKLSAASDITVSDEEFRNEYLDMVTNQFGSWDEYTNTLAEYHISTAQFARAVLDQLRLIKLVRREMGATPVTVADARAYYEAHSNESDFPASIALSQIFIRARAEDSATTQSNNIAQLRRIRAQILAGLSFAQAAEQYSECPSRARGGALGTIYQGDQTISDLISTAAFALAISNVSDVVESEHGYHLLYVTARRPAYTAAFEEIQQELQQALTEERERRALNQWLRRVREEAVVEKKF